MSRTKLTPAQINTGTQQAFVSTGETTTSTSYTDLATTTDSVTVNIGANGMALVAIYAELQNNTALNVSTMGINLSGANTVSPVDDKALIYMANANSSFAAYGATFLYTGLSVGSTTFKLKYKVGGGTGTFYNRRIAVIPL